MVPVKDAAAAEAELNAFLRSKRVVGMKKELIADGESSFWSFCVEYLDGPGPANAPGKTGKVDYRELLSPADFAVFSKLRDWRRVAAEAKGVPVYTVLSNEQLAQIVQKRVGSKAALREVDGVGEARVEEYGEAVVRIMLESKSSMAPQSASAAEEAARS